MDRMIREMVGPAEARNGLSQAERRTPSPHPHHVHPLSILFILSIPFLKLIQGILQKGSSSP